MKVESMAVGMIGTNCYLLWDESAENAAAIIDPGGEAERILQRIEALSLQPKMILLTHGHFDHVLGVPALLKAYPGLPVYITEVDYPLAVTGGQFHYPMGEVDSVCFYDDGDNVTLGSLCIDVLRTPGHTPGGVVLRVNDILFTGDTLFAGSCGRTDFEGGSTADMQCSLKRLKDLDGDYVVYPGHMQSTTLEQERKTNPYFRHL